MSGNSLLDLSTELIIEIFKSTKSFATATSFSSTSRIFRAIWKMHSRRICYEILSDTIICYDQAFAYVKAQPLAVIGPEHYAIAQPLADKSPEHIGDTTPVLTKVVRQFFDNADIAYRAWQFYEDLVSEYVFDETRMTRYVSNKTFGHGDNQGGQCISFLQAWYRIHTLACDTLPCDMLASLDILELEQMREVMCWLRDFCPKEHKRMLCITFQYEWLQGWIPSREFLKCSINEEHWNTLQNRLKAQYQELTETYFDNRSRPIRASLFCFYDLSLDRQSGNRTTSIADIEPRTGERHALDRLYRFDPQRHIRKFESTNSK